jgi:L-methionine (R)-S-oxide reductase
MAESVAFSKTADRGVIYGEIIPQIDALIADEPDLIANLANVAAVLKEAFGFFWVGFYLKKGDQLVLGPFQGPLACTRIDFGNGVCGHAYSTASTVVVPNVDEFPGHIACSSDAKSEIVVPIMDGDGGVLGVLDVDSDRLDDFSETDRDGLSGVVSVIERVIRSHTNSDKLE